MELKFALLADYAGTMQGGKLVVAGEFDRLHALRAPVRALFYIVGRFDAHVSEGSEHTLRVGLYDADGGQVGAPMPDVPLKFHSGRPGRPLRGQFIVKAAVTFPDFGDYTVHLTVDGRTLGVIALDLARVERAEGPMLSGPEN